MHYAILIPTLCSRLIKRFGWSPLHKSIEFSIEEGFETAFTGKRFVGTITSVKEGDLAATIQTVSGETLELATRHAGYGFYYLPVGGIAAYLLSDRMGDNRIAQGILTLQKCG